MPKYNSSLSMQPRRPQCCIWRDLIKPSLRFAFFCVFCVFDGNHLDLYRLYRQSFELCQIILWVKNEGSVKITRIPKQIWTFCVCTCSKDLFFSCYNSFVYRIYPKYWDKLTPYHTCPKHWISSFHYTVTVAVSKNWWMSGKQCRPWSDAAFCAVWSGSTLFALACLSHYLGSIRYLVLFQALYALYEKGVPFNERLVFIHHGEQHEDWFHRISPRGEVPALQDGEESIVGSDNIIDYVDKRCPQGTSNDYICVEALRPSQRSGVRSSAVSLPNHIFTGQAYPLSG